MRRTDRAEVLLDEAEPWDLLVLDEAHHARRCGAGSQKEGGPNTLLKLMQGLKVRTRGLVLLTATPMQGSSHRGLGSAEPTRFTPRVDLSGVSRFLRRYRAIEPFGGSPGPYGLAVSVGRTSIR